MQTRLNKLIARRNKLTIIKQKTLQERTSMKIHFYYDPAHGWAKVKRSQLEKLGIADKITGYSYQYGNNVYLEEDCDLDLFMKSYVGLVTFIEHYTNNYSHIRSYESYEFKTNVLTTEKLLV